MTGLRGAAALWVAAYHLLLPAHFVTGLPARMLQRGYLAVDLFFMLSGFVIALNYGGLFRIGIRLPAVARFLARRAARLYPIYGLILVARFAYTAARYRTFALPRPWIAAPLHHPVLEIPANMLLVQTWGIARQSSIGPAWSISTEWGAYFAFPALAMLILWRRAATAWAMAGVAFALVAATAVVDISSGYHEGALDAWNGLSAGPLMRCLGGFTFGILLYRLTGQPRAAALAGAESGAAVALAVFLAALAWGAPDLAIYPLFAALVATLAAGHHRIAAVFAWRPVVWLGEISYSLYLLHIFLLHPLDVTRAAARLHLSPAAADIVAPALILALLLAVSGLSYRWIEQPGRALMQRLLTPAAGPENLVHLTANS